MGALILFAPVAWIAHSLRIGSNSQQIFFGIAFLVVSLLAALTLKFNGRRPGLRKASIVVSACVSGAWATRNIFYALGHSSGFVPGVFIWVFVVFIHLIMAEIPPYAALLTYEAKLTEIKKEIGG